MVLMPRINYAMRLRFPEIFFEARISAWHALAAGSSPARHFARTNDPAIDQMLFPWRPSQDSFNRPHGIVMGVYDRAMDLAVANSRSAPACNTSGLEAAHLPFLH